jgi:hypothetical protein
LQWHFQVQEELYQQPAGRTMCSPLYPVTSNIHMQNFEEEALEQTDMIPKIWLK